MIKPTIATRSYAALNNILAVCRESIGHGCENCPFGIDGGCIFRTGAFDPYEWSDAKYQRYLDKIHELEGI